MLKKCMWVGGLGAFIVERKQKKAVKRQWKIANPVSFLSILSKYFLLRTSIGNGWVPVSNAMICLGRYELKTVKILGM
jgi:hypothetical protein